jgi:hypothetical protein
MERKSIYLVLSLLLIQFLAGCASPTPAKDFVVPTASPTPAKNFVFPTALPTIGLHENTKGCLSIETQIPPEIELKGGILLHGVSDEYSNEIVLMNLSTNAIIKLEKNIFSIDSLGVSPDGKWVAYLVFNENDYSDKRLFVENFAAGLLIDLPLSKEWGMFSLRGWLNNSDLLITTLENTNYPPVFLALNPFTEEVLTLDSVFPYQEISPPTRMSAAEYDPSLNYVLYPAKKNDIGGFVLLDRQRNEEIVFSPAQTLVEVGSPKWSHDGQKYVFLSKKLNVGMYNIGTLDGEVELISYLPQEMTSFIVTGLSWSPDDKFVAVVIYDVWKEMEKLILLDVATKKIIDLCVDVDYRHWPFASDFPVWSPDGRQIIVEKQSKYGKNEVILIDISQMQAGILTSDQRVLGWISLEP